MQTETLTHSIPPLLVFFSMFLLLYLLAYQIVFRSWSPKTRPEASSCFISLFHGTPAVLLSTIALLSNPLSNFSSLNTNLQNLVLDFCSAYFLMDLLHYLVFIPGDVLFMGHHAATLFVLLTCRFVVARGAYGVLVLLVLAEVTSACQNCWTLAGIRKGESVVARRVYDFLSPPFYAFYTVVRGFVGPFFVYKMGVFYVNGVADDVVPMWARVSWLVVVVTAISVSILWVLNLWVELYRERWGKLEKKIR